MSSRDKILATVKQNQPKNIQLPELSNYIDRYDHLAEKFVAMARGIGATVYEVRSYDAIVTIIKEEFGHIRRIITTCADLEAIAEVNPSPGNPHDFEDVDLFITTSTLGVAENGALWITDAQLPERVLPFITQELSIIIKKESIVPKMHDAYDLIGNIEYGYAAFIAGPSKTADIEQSLVLGAHGPMTMTIFIVD
jgi:L-lactate dehydrogenase complex protein LldG